MKFKRFEAYFEPTQYNEPKYSCCGQDADNNTRRSKNEREKQKLASTHPRKLRRK